MTARTDALRQKRIADVERDRQALELAKAGISYDRIAERLTYANRSGAWKAVQRALKATIQPVADEYRALELMRLDGLLMAMWPQATKGNQGAVDRVLKIMERRAAYMGLDAPKEVKIAHEMEAFAVRVAADLGLNPDDVIAEAERIVAAAGVAG